MWEGRGHGATAELVMGGSRGARSLAAAPACGARTQPLGRVLATHVEGTHLMSVSLQPAGMELAKLYWASISNDLNTKLNGFATQAAAGMLCSARRGGRGRSWRRHSGAGSSASRQHRQPQAPNQAYTPADAWLDPHRRREQLEGFGVGKTGRCSRRRRRRSHCRKHAGQEQHLWARALQPGHGWVACSLGRCSRGLATC